MLSFHKVVDFIVTGTLMADMPQSKQIKGLQINQYTSVSFH